MLQSGKSFDMESFCCFKGNHPILDLKPFFKALLSHMWVLCKVQSSLMTALDRHAGADQFSGLITPSGGGCVLFV